MKEYKTWLVVVMAALGLLLMALSWGQSGSNSPWPYLCSQILPGPTSASGLVRGCLARELVSWCPGGPFGTVPSSADNWKLSKKTSGISPLQAGPKVRPMI